MSADLERLAELIFSHEFERRQAIEASGNRFVYYTTAGVASLILSNEEVWLRNATLMNDFSEIAHGFACLNAAYNGRPGETLRRMMDDLSPGLRKSMEDEFAQLIPSIQTDTYLTCFSEHDPSEDVRGRLSMWRAYGDRNGAAIVINGAVMHSPSVALGAFSSPVLYADPSDFSVKFGQVVETLGDNLDLLRRVGADTVRDLICQMMRFAVLCTKHPAFAEEREWRVIASPSLFSTPRLLSSLEVVRGVPQKVLKIHFGDDPSSGLAGFTADALVNRVIVGPCAFPLVTALAFVEQLKALGIANAEKRVVVADVPLRHDA